MGSGAGWGAGIGAGFGGAFGGLFGAGLGAGLGGMFGSMFGGGGGMKRQAQQLLSNPGMVGQGNYYFPNMAALSVYGSGLQGSNGPGGLPTLNGAPLFQTQGGGYAFMTNQGTGLPTTSPTQGSLQEWLAQGISPEELTMQPGAIGGFTPNNMEFMNELGFPETLPGPETAPLIQFLSEKTVAARNSQLGRQATGVLGSGLNSLQAYRPGGAQGLLSNTYGQLAQSYLAQQTQAPNLMLQLELMLYGQSLQQAKQSGRQGFYGNIIGGGISALGGLFGGIGGSMFAEGGVVSPRRGGTRMSINGQNSVVGEAGEHEVVSPLSKVKDVAKAVAEGEKEAGGKVQGPQPYAGEGPTGGAQSPANPEGGQLSSKQPPTEGMPGSDQGMGGLGIAPDELDAHFVMMDMAMEPGKPTVGSLMTRQLDEMLVEDNLWEEAFSG